MATISGSVGRKGKNVASDVLYVQKLLNENIPVPMRYISLSGKVDDQTIAVIERFQAQTLNMKKPDGKVDPAGKTLAALMPSTLPTPLKSPPRLSEADLQVAATTLACEVEAIKAVNDVESRGDGFFASGKPKILFERHVFSRLTGHIYDKSHSNISQTKAGGYGASGEHQYARLYEAMACDRTAALKSASWGRFQIMGFNHATSGFGDVDSYVNKMYISEGEHLKAFTTFISNDGAMLKALQEKRWADFAKRYNGTGYKKNAYDVKLKKAYDSHVAKKAAAASAAGAAAGTAGK